MPDTATRKNKIIVALALTGAILLASVPTIFVALEKQETIIDVRKVASPDGAYIAILRDADTGAVGSNSGVLLIPAGSHPSDDFRDAIAIGPPGAFDILTWTGKRTLSVASGVGRASPDWMTKWRDVKIIYK